MLQQPPLSQAQPSSLAGPEPHSFPMLKLLLLQAAAPIEGPHPSPGPHCPVHTMLLWQRFPCNYISCNSPCDGPGLLGSAVSAPNTAVHCGVGLATQTSKKPSRAQLELLAGQGLREQIQH